MWLVNEEKRRATVPRLPLNIDFSSPHHVLNHLGVEGRGGEGRDHLALWVTSHAVYILILGPLGHSPHPSLVINNSSTIVSQPSLEKSSFQN